MLTSDQITEIFFLVDEFCIYFEKNLSKWLLESHHETDKKTRNKPCKGKLYGDKGYIVRASVFEKLFYEGVQLVTKIRRNMKNKLMNIHDKIMLRKRSVIECVMDSLKNTCQIEHSRHRSIHGFIINAFSAIAAYHFIEKKPSLASHFDEPTEAIQLSM